MKLAALSLALLAATTAQASEFAPLVTVQNGEVAGQTLAEGTRVFRGIPYARPPIGDLRWKPPLPAVDWAGTLDGRKAGPACVQPPLPSDSVYFDPPSGMSEDCLTLNVWAPRAARSAPVMVWIHGGSLVSGYGASPVYDGAKLAGQGVVFVSINYRLGILGFLSHPALSAESPDRVSGNYGLLDQIEALKWVKANIAAFGGDPANVTVFGESAGALSVSALLVTPLARGLFHKAIAESSYIVSTPALRTTSHGTPSAEHTGLLVSAAFDAPDAAALRAIPADTLVRKSAKLGYAPWLTIDGHVLPKQLVDSFDAGEQSRVPLLAGFNSGEIRTLRFLAPKTPADPAAYQKAIRANYADLADTYLSLYPPSDLDGSALNATRDAIYGWTAQHMVAKQSSVGQSAYLYYFSHSYPAADQLKIPAFHAAEVPYVFGLVGPGAKLPANWPAAPDTQDEVALSDAIVGYWTSFAKTGIPSSPGHPKWAAFGKEQAFMEFRDRAKPGSRLLPGSYGLHNEVICRRRLAGDQPWLANVGTAAGAIPKAPCVRSQSGEN